jgi:hypothetical protein
MALFLKDFLFARIKVLNFIKNYHSHKKKSSIRKKYLNVNKNILFHVLKNLEINYSKNFILARKI